MEDVAGAVVVCAVAASEGYDAVTPAAVRILQHVFHWRTSFSFSFPSFIDLLRRRSRQALRRCQPASPLCCALAGQYPGRRKGHRIVRLFIRFIKRVLQRRCNHVITKCADPLSRLVTFANDPRSAGARTPPLPESFDPLVEEALAQLPVDDVLPKPEKIPSHLPPWPRAHTFKRTRVRHFRHPLWIS